MNERPGRREFLKTAASAGLGMLVSPFFSFAKPESAIERAAYTMGSIVTFTLYHDDPAGADRALDAAIREMKSIDALMSVFDPASQLSQVNALAAGTELAVDPRIIEVVMRARDFSAATKGAFDPTVEPLMELYGFRDDERAGRFPSDTEIARVLEAVGMKNVRADAGRSTLALEHPGTKLDFGGIAVGYAVDRAAAILKSHGIASCLINHSGDLYAIGRPPDADRWLIGIRDPAHAGGIAATMQIRDQALCTSGNYEHFVVAGGRTIGHILDPATGRDAENILSATVVAPSAVEADALSTALFVLGESAGRKALAGRAGVSGLVVSQNDRALPLGEARR